MFRLFADWGAPCGQASGIDPLAAVALPVWIHDRAWMAHAKTMGHRWRGHAPRLFQLDLRPRGELRGPEPHLLSGRRGGLCRALAPAAPDLGSFHSARGLVPGFVGGSAVTRSIRSPPDLEMRP
jgi:hypothetical protein